jgi:uncharacterized membrane protein HdeD (DUF308 family)
VTCCFPFAAYLSSLSVLIKLLLTPLLMLAVSWAARRWGPGIGGLLAGLPLTSGPISIYLCAEQGPHFAASAAANSILSLMPVALFSVVYSRLADRLPVIGCALGSFGVFLLSLYFLQKSGFSFWPAWITGFLAISIGLVLTPNKVPAKFQIQYPQWDLPARVFSATAMVLIITLSASVLGSQWSGLLSPIPVLAWPLCAFVHHQQGSDGARAVLRGILEGAYGVLIFYTIVAVGLGHLSPIFVYVAAILASLIVSVPWLKSKLVLPAE